MHIPDGVLGARVSVALAGVGVTGFALAARSVRASMKPISVPTLGFLAATILVLQMLNFPLVGPTSAHLTGTSLLVCLAGFDAAVLVMAPVLVIQAFLFHDGGLSALGANYVNIALIPAVVCAAILAVFRREARSNKGSALVAGFAAFAATVTGAFACAVDLACSGVVRMGPALSWIVGVQSLTGVFEGLLTGTVLLYLSRRSGSLGSSEPFPARRWQSAAPWIAALLVAALLIPVASARPDALEYTLRVASGSFSNR